MRGAPLSLQPRPLLSALLLLAACACCVTAAPLPPLCQGLNSLTARVPWIDGFTGTALADFSWVQSNCVSNSGRSFSYDSGWVDIANDALQPNRLADGTLSGSGGKLRRTVTVHVEDVQQQVLSLNISVTFRLTVNGTLPASSGTTTPFSSIVLGTLSKVGGSFPVSAMSSFPLVWRGDLQTDLSSSNPSAASLLIVDGDLLDGMPAAFLYRPTPSVKPSLRNLTMATLSLAARPNLRLSQFSATPSSLRSSSIRGAFLDSVSLPSTSIRITGGDLLWEGPSQQGALLQSRTSCNGPAECPTSLSTSLERLVTASVLQGASQQSLCSSLFLLPDTLSSYLTLDIFATEERITARGMGAHTHALFRCDNSSVFLGIYLTAIAPLTTTAAADAVSGWPTLALFSDDTATANLLRTIPVLTSGIIAGGDLPVSSSPPPAPGRLPAKTSAQVAKGGEREGSSKGNVQMYSVLPYNLFSSVHAGILIPVLPLDSLPAGELAFIGKLFEQIRSLLTTPVAVVNQAVKNLFPTDSTGLQPFLTTYHSQTQAPSLQDFLRWFGERRGLSPITSRDGNTTSLVIQTPNIKGSLTVGGDDLAVQNANSAIQELARQVRQRYPAIDPRFQAPAIDSSLSVLQASQVSGYLTTSVSISGDKVILSTPLVFSAVVSMQAQWPAVGNPMFTCANIVYDHTTRLARIQACVSSALHGIIPGTLIGLTETGELAIDVPYQPSSYVAGLNAAAHNIEVQRWASDVLYPLSYNFGIMAGQNNSFAAVITVLANALSTLSQPMSGWKLANSLCDLIRAEAASDPSLILFASVAPLNSALRVDILVHRQVTATLATERSTWKFMTDTRRLSLPMNIYTRLRFTVTPSGSGDLTEYSVHGGAKHVDWTIPFTFNMLSGTMAQASADLTLNLPSSSSLTLTMDVATDLGGMLKVQIQASDLTKRELPPQISVNAADGGSMVSSLSALTVLKEGILGSLPQAFGSALNVPLSPLAEPLSKVHGFEDLLKAKLPWLHALTAAERHQLVVSQPFCPSGPQGPLSMNVTINKGTMTICKADSLLTQSLDQLSNSLNVALQGCHLDPFLAAVVADRGGAACGTVALVPSVAGAVWDLEVTTEPVGNVSFIGRWTAGTVPAFATWEDLSWLLHGVFSGYDNIFAYRPPVYTTIQRDDVPQLVPPALRQVYPQQFVAIQQGIAADHRHETDFAITSRFNAMDNVISMDVSGGRLGGEVKASLSATMVTVLDVPPLGGRGNITVMTNFSSTGPFTINATMVPSTPGNTFSLMIGAQLRSPSAQPITMTVTHSIVLSPGKLLRDALLQEVLPQINETLRPMFTVSEMPGDPLLQSIPQVRFDLRYVSLPATQEGQEEVRWLVPLSLSIMNPLGHVPALQNATNVPARALLLSKNTSMGLSLDLEASLPQATGRYAVLAMNSSRISARSQLQVAIKGSAPYQLMGHLIAPRSKFFDYFNAAFNVNSSTSLQNLLLDFVKMDIPPPDVLLHNIGTWKLAALSDLTDFTQQLASWQVAFSGAQQSITAFQSLLNTNNSVCGWLTLAQDLSDILTTNELARQFLPMSQHTFAGLLDSGLLSLLKDVQSSVCNKKEPFTLALLCAVMKDVYRQDVCANALVDAHTLAVDLQVSLFNRSFEDRLRFDTSALFGPGFPFGIGAESDMNLQTGFDMRLRLLARFEDDGGVSLALDHEATRMSLAMGFAMDGNIKASFGPLSVTFSEAHGWLGYPANLTARLSPSGSLALSLTGTAGLDAFIALGSGSHDKCGLLINISSIYDFITGRQFPDIIQQGCEGGFLEMLERALLQNTLFDYFSELIFMQDWESEIQAFLSRLLGRGGILVKLGLPLVDKLVEDLITAAIGDLVGPELTKNFVVAITNMTNDMLTKYDFSFDPTYIESLVLEAFTKVLCQELSGVLRGPCPAVPDVHADEYKWLLPFGSTVRKPIQNMDFGLGDHGFASLELLCEAELILSWNFTVELVFNYTHGVRLRFPEDPVFSGALSMSVADGCRLSGDIGYVGLDLRLVTTGSNATKLEGRFAVDSQFNPDFWMDVRLFGAAEIGLGGELAERIAHTPDALDALPHWQASLGLSWKWKLHDNLTPPQFYISDIHFCVGRLLINVVRVTTEQTIGKLLDPLDPVLGPDGILLRPIPGLSHVFGNDINLIQVLFFFCQVGDECHYQGVLEMLETFVDVYRKLELIVDLTKVISKDQCNVVQAVQDFYLDFTKETVEPKFTGPLPPPGLQFHGKDAAAKKEVSSFYTSITTSGKFGVRLYMFDNVAKNLVSAMMGIDFPLAGVTLPDLEFGMGLSWSIPIWPWPEVELGLAVSASLRVSFGEVALMYSGLADAFKSGSPAMVVHALALPARNNDGSERWPLQARVSVTGSVSIGIFIFEGQAFLTLTLTGQVRFVDIDGNGWVTFNEIAYLVKLNGWWGALDKRVTLGARFGLAIRACIELIFDEICWDIVKLSWGHEWPIINQPATYPAISDPYAKVNLDLVGFRSHAPATLMLPASSSSMAEETYISSRRHQKGRAIAPLSLAEQDGVLFYLFETPAGGLSVDYAPSGVSFNSGFAHMSRGKLTASAITYKGNPGTAPFTWVVGNVVHQQVNLPPYDNARLRLIVSEFRDSTTIKVSPTLVAPESVPGVSITRCGFLHLTSPAAGVTYALSGVPAPSLLESLANNNVTLDSALKLYDRRPINVTGESDTLAISVEAAHYTISTHLVQATTDTQQLQLYLPPSYQWVRVAGNREQPTTYLIQENPPGTTLRALAGTGDDLFVVPSVTAIQGNTQLIGGGGIDTANFTLITQQQLHMKATASPYSLVMWNGSPNDVHTIRHTSVENRNYHIIGAADTHSSFSLVAPVREDSIHVYSIGAPGGSIYQQITGCDGKSDVRIFLQNGSNHEVEIGQNNKISSLECTMWIYGSSNRGQNDTIHIRAASENRPLRFDIQENALLAFDTINEKQYFHLLFDEIERVTIQFGQNGTELNVIRGTLGTEYLFNFTLPSNLTASENITLPINNVRVVSSNSPILLMGTINQLALGQVQSALSSTHPLRDIVAPIALAQPQPGQSKVTTTPVKVILNSGMGPQAPPQHYYLDQSCLASQLKNGSIAPLSYNQSSWMCTLMQAVGFPADPGDEPCRACPLVYSGFMNLTIETGWADDTFVGRQVHSALVNVNLGPGGDVVTWQNVSSLARGVDAHAFFDLGVGNDSLALVMPCRAVVARLGDDRASDDVTVWYTDSQLPQPSIQGSIIGPLDPLYASSVLTLEQLKVQDLPFVRRRSQLQQASNDYGVVSLAAAPGFFSQGKHTPTTTLFSLVREQVVIINVTVPGQVDKYEPASYTTYKIVGIAPEAVVVIDGQGRSEPPLQPARNWTVEVNLPTPLDHAAYVNVWSLRGTGAILAVNVDGPDNSILYNMLVEKMELPEMGRVTLGGLLVQASAIDHLSLSTQQPINITVKGTPADADLRVSTPATPPSFLRLERMLNNSLAINTTTIVSPSVVEANVSVVAVGLGGHTLLNYTFSDIQYFNGCLRQVGSLVNSTASAQTEPVSWWLGEQLQQLGIDPQAVQANCTFYSRHSGELNVSTPQTEVTGLGKQRALYRLVLLFPNVTAEIKDSGSEPWSHTLLHGNLMTVEDDLEVLLSHGGSCLVNSTNLFVGGNKDSSVQIACGGATSSSSNFSSSFSSWNFGHWQEYNSTALRFHGPSCNGSVVSIASSRMMRLPYISFVDAAEYPSAIHFFPLVLPHNNSSLPTYNRTVVFGPTSLRGISSTSFNHSKKPILANQAWLEWLANTSLPLTVHLHDGFSSVYLSNTTSISPPPILAVHNTSEAMLLSQTRTSLRLLHAQVSIDPQHSAITPHGPLSFDQSTCLDPRIHCRDEAWVRMGITDVSWLQDRLPCSIDNEHKCEHYERLRVVSDGKHSLLCQDPSHYHQQHGFKLLISSNTTHWPSAPTDNTHSTFVIVFFFVIAATGYFAWWMYASSPVPLGWGCIVITASLQKAFASDDITASSALVSLLKGAQWSVSSLLSYCEPYGAAHLTILALFMFLVALFLNLLALQVLLARHLRDKFGWRLTQRAILAATIFLSPFVIGQTPAESSWSIALIFFSFLFLLLGGLGFLLFTWHYPPIKYEDAENRQHTAWLRSTSVLLTLGVTFFISVLGRPDAPIQPSVFVAFASICVIVEGVAQFLALWVLVRQRAATSGRIWTIVHATVTLTATLCGLVFLIWIRADAANVSVSLWYLWLLLPFISCLVYILPLPSFCACRKVEPSYTQLPTNGPEEEESEHVPRSAEHSHYELSEVEE
ncbi:hypothetical protein QOT17_000772 [Balamuthia mandrillaris]